MHDARRYLMAWLRARRYDKNACFEMNTCTDICQDLDVGIRFLLVAREFPHDKYFVFG
ncbi:hypothetical protein MPTK1_8g01150 [Marchantia polymorpha subsp. ruderalis]|uniref:Uncharacterized protein n=1 Tax=Marchantia polymorpha TaxID=3197 RepID=A0A2R6WRD4_MARPO|nr:hypothetical protein MARPO_0064s0083 [Marchantia polymorpha]BBN18266.1 hypothetical protein Mp_8g01150 [Marchantia polymorpha subsp. ruderalis]|eukprot:PTQ36406.1 hypothetical protein MARPO_0064s0083 [Marchantia polymorpha]